jgi:hypothetical protein
MVSGPKRVDIAFDAVSAMAQSNRSKAAAARVRPLSSAGQAARSRWDQGFESGFLQRRVRSELLARKPRSALVPAAVGVGQSSRDSPSTRGCVRAAGDRMAAADRRSVLRSQERLG